MTGVSIRPARESDMSYVYDTWLKALRPEYPDMRTGDYYDWMRGKVEGLLEGLRGYLYVAHPDDEDEVIWGWALVSSGYLWFVYVRPEHRRQGLARKLSEWGLARWVGRPVTVRHLTEDARAIKRTHPNLLRYIPA